MDSSLNSFISHIQKLMIEKFSESFQQVSIPEQLKKSMLYSLEAGGKRLRPVLVIASYKAFSKDTDKVISTALALEMIHTYSLIHDDLPAMDNDDYRRGKLTNHRAFDEATAILAGDALLTYSFEMITNDPLLSNEEKVEIIRMLAKCSGAEGMVAGQILDIEAENHPVSLAQLEKIHKLKTGELIKFAIYAGAYLGGASKEQLRYLQSYASYLGLLFQIQDDILDVIGDEKILGKAVGSDENKNKSTYPKLLGIEGAIKQKEKYAEIAKQFLGKADADTLILKGLIDYFSQRDH